MTIILQRLCAFSPATSKNSSEAVIPHDIFVCKLPLVNDQTSHPYIDVWVRGVNNFLGDFWVHPISWILASQDCRQARIRIELIRITVNVRVTWMWNGTMFDDFDWPLNASCSFVSIS